MKRPLDRCDDLAAEFRIVAAGLGLERDAVGDDVGRFAAVDEADVAGAAVLALFDQAVPAVAGQVGDGQRGDGDGADALLRADAGVAGEPFDVDHHPIAAGRADRHLFARAAVPVEAHRRLAEQALLHAAARRTGRFLPG